MARPFPAHPEPPVVALVLAGGRGSRLSPLTDARAKPAVPFAGSFRMIDVVLSNIAHSGLENVWIVEQYRPFTLNRHLAGGRPWDLDSTRHGLQILPPAEGRSEEGFAAGNGHALHQQVPLLESFGASTVVVLSADHLYHLDLRPVLEQHAERGSELTVVTTEVPGDPSRYGVVQVDDDGAVTRYDYKPEQPEGQLVATEVFVYSVEALAEVTRALVAEEKASEAAGEADHDPEIDGDSLGDYGESIIPALVERGRAHEYRLDGYWRDIGTIDAYFQAHMDLVEGKGLELDRHAWPLLTNPRETAPAWIGPSASVRRSLVSPGARVEGEVEDSVIGPGVTVERGARVRRSVLLGDAVVPTGASLDAVVADLGADIPASAVGESKPGPGNITVLVPARRGPAESSDETTGV
ncbi:glucose-1-phosphate adenylyltransferase family protein [Falsarthrobacter nasiphocae]|uniref:Glucose-1-phosphate adenylyltransferase n=1 Tax=Falsarthrobacter nasiphocae TaxID=189863 RepID=A0AAE3YJ49_9MICC|nr:sugar phosphate nucleotidyltransferase [Falsarthrobacter nasiphocae]MDR6892933.1 glucose-1-phosphate adenylyltransferase [Falsarthrobacter nasiphocae]